MSRKVWPAKDPNANARYGFNWSPKNLGADVITSITCNVVSGTAVCEGSSIGEVPNAHEGQGTIHRFSGGTPGELNEILLEIETNGGPPDGDIFQQTVYLPIRNQ
jgi:hypothetical protein